ncbi:MAG: hypothetical protein U0L22_05735 [Bacteroidales bacterium]|nr:hypothetical protein [Bacteroidales bacterium]
MLNILFQSTIGVRVNIITESNTVIAPSETKADEQRRLPSS